MEKKETEEMVLASGKIQNLLEGKAVRKIIVVPNRLVNLVV
jgi:leucyl-tRNA synthetase